MLHKLSERKAKHIRSLSTSKMRKKYGEYLVEGFSLVEEALGRPRDVRLVAVANSMLERATLILDICEAKAIPVFTVNDSEFPDLATTVTPQGVLAVVDRNIDMARKLFMEALEKDISYIVYLDGIQDPGNMGAIIRSAEAVGASAILAGENTVQITNPKVIRGSMGAFFHIPVVEHKEIGMGVNAIKKYGFTVSTTLISPQATDIWEYEPPKKIMMVFGNEAHGISFDIIDKADDMVTIPIDGKSESFGVTASASIISAVIRNRHKRMVE
ncbi:MAG: TrmH family RNA methyltransferase [Candidatus Zixiibacteriota bacterium]